MRRLRAYVDCEGQGHLGWASELDHEQPGYLVCSAFEAISYVDYSGYWEEKWPLGDKRGSYYEVQKARLSSDISGAWPRWDDVEKMAQIQNLRRERKMAAKNRKAGRRSRSAVSRMPGAWIN